MPKESTYIAKLPDADGIYPYTADEDAIWSELYSRQIALLADKACDEYLQTQIALGRPALLVLLGNTPTKWILKTTEGISKLRGRWFSWKGMSVLPMFHPSYLLRYPSSTEGSPKHLTWLDIQEVKRQWDAVKATGSISGIKFG